ncbi:phosphatidylinositol 4-phosphate 5-kinase-like protein 1 isoform X1 [Scyliorhinus canicula]|uniref:phosphatidylinositol 4-phosphate 5-kinase-like protein 1 isoform X1 n=1 Tax=Scyliorhinus canicula TaxID=7830 RepID=UPI0018F590B0|nr:phosphatidylinositol 4-phosphate 5-kinase-like protein 1 isoform X1 [Scyliorhinus canicula]
MSMPLVKERKVTDSQDANMNQRSAAKRKFLWRVRQKWKLLGLFEIDRDHEFYGFTCMLKEGLTAAVQVSIDNPQMGILSEPDFSAELTQVHEGFEMQTFAGPVFAKFRAMLGMSETEYQQSLSSEGFYLQFISNSKSKANFFLTNDKRIFLKTQDKREMKFLLSNLRSYIQHMEKYPHSLLVKFLGVHSIKMPRERMKYFIVMQSVFYPDERIVDRYDIKGCQVSRWTDPSPEGSNVIVVLKDLNYEGNSICLDQQRSWFVRQMAVDTEYLKGLNVLDYSLLLAHQPLHLDERRQSWSFANVILRTKKSMTSGGSPTASAGIPVPGLVEEESAVLVAETVSGTDECHVKEIPGATLNSAGSGDTESELAEPAVQNRRLLPDTRNSLHVIDGAQSRYFVGIIDIFTVYGFRKKLEHLWKSIRYRGQSFSTVSPDRYAKRLCQWVDDHTV